MIITVFYQKYYTDEHNKAIRYLVNNLKGIKVLQDSETGTRVEIQTAEALTVIEALEACDCLYFED